MTLRAAAALLALVSLASAVQAGGAAPWVDPSCGTPLGLEAAAGANAVLARAADPEYDTVDALRMPGAQRSPEALASAWGRLVLAAEVKVDEGSNFTWAIFARVHSNATGWNAPAVWLSSPNTSRPYPQGVHVHPSAAVFQERVWVAWDAQGSEFGGGSDRLILLRSVGSGGDVSEALRASQTDPNATTQHPVLAVFSGGLGLAYSTSDGDAAVGDTHIVFRSFDGGAFSPTVAVSNVSDGWSDALPSLADDGAGGLAAAWTSTDPSGSSTRLMFARYSSGTWSGPRALAELGRSPSSAPALAALGGRVYVAFSTTHPQALNGTDADVRILSYDVAGATFSQAAQANPEPSNGDDTAPTLAAFGGRLFLGWSTDEDFYYAAGADTDAVYRTFDGAAFGPVVTLSEPAQNNSDASPSFLAVGAHLYAHWMLTPPPLPGTPRGDSREAVRLVARPPQWYDGLRLTYRFGAVSENGSALLEVVAWPPEAEGRSLIVRLPDGRLFPVEDVGPPRSVWVPVDPAAADLEILACGKAAALLRGEAPEPPRPSLISPLWVVGAAALAAAVALVAFRRRRG